MRRSRFVAADAGYFPGHVGFNGQVAVPGRHDGQKGLVGRRLDDQRPRLPGYLDPSASRRRLGLDADAPEQIALFGGWDIGAYELADTARPEGQPGGGWLIGRRVDPATRNRAACPSEG